MMKKRIFCCLMALMMVLCATGALAAPVRDEKNMDVPIDEHLRNLVSVYAGAALLRGVTALEAGETPPQALIEGTLLMGLARVVLPRENEQLGDATLRLDEATLAGYYADLFQTGAFHMPQAPQCPCITMDDGALVFDISDAMVDDTSGAYIYQVTRSGNMLTILADMYTAPAFFGFSAENIPEDNIVWEAGMELVLEMTDASALGYRLASFSTTPAYLDGALSNWQTIEHPDHGYTALIPAIFSVCQGNAYQTADGTATLTFEVLDDLGSERLDNYVRAFSDANPDAQVRVEADLGMFYATTQSSYTLYIVPQDAYNAFCITLTYPKERAREFELYGEIIRNTFWGDGLANG